MMYLKTSLFLLLVVMATSCGGDNDHKRSSEDYNGRVFGKVEFQYRRLAKENDEIVLGTELFREKAGGLLSLLVDKNGNVLASSSLDENGAFDFNITRPVKKGDKVLFVPALLSSTNEVVFTVLNAGTVSFQEKQEDINVFADLWVWSVPVPSSGKVGRAIIKEDDGSGAVFIFSMATRALQDVVKYMLEDRLENLKPIAYIWAPGKDWKEDVECVSCYVPPNQNITLLVNNSSVQFQQFVFLGGSRSGSSAWGAPVLLHELGHYVMQNYSRDDSLGGKHLLGEKIEPAFAFSEGWASFFATSAMGRWSKQPYPYFWNIQQNSFFWLNYNEISPESAIALPTLDGGIEQDIDESFVASALYNLWDGKDVAEVGEDDGAALGTEAVFSAISSSRFKRQDRGALGADLVDFVDALVCASPQESTNVDNTLQYFGFPYDSGNSICH